MEISIHSDLNTATFPWGMPGGFTSVLSYPGANKAANPMISAQNDLEAVFLWMHEKGRYSKDTAQSMRREVDRFLLWLSADRNKSLSDAKRDDFLLYSEFVLNPSDQWVSGRRYSRSSPNWRPFITGLTENSRDHALAILSSLMNWLQDSGVGWLEANPMPSFKKATRTGFNPTIRSLPSELIPCIRKALKAKAGETPKDKTYRMRDLWMFELFYGMANRTSESIASTQKLKKVNIDGRPTWLWDIKGKGNKNAALPVPALVILKLAEFRAQIKMPPYPVPNDPLPLIPALSRLKADGTLSGLPRPMSRSAIYKRFASLFKQAAAIAQEEGLNSAPLLEASTHWLRHTVLREVAEQTKDIRAVQAIGRHANINTSAKYTTQQIDEIARIMKTRTAKSIKSGK